MDSLTRRIAQQISTEGDVVEFVQYGSSKNEITITQENIRQSYHTSFDKALKHIKDIQCEHVISIYIKPADRLKYSSFRKRENCSIKFHHVYSSWNESRIKRELLFAEARLFPYNGCLFCVSPRIYNYVSNWSQQSVLLLPPVPKSYFCTPEDKQINTKLRITYAGRVDTGKGTMQAVEVFHKLSSQKNVESKILGFAWDHKPETIKLHNNLLADPNITYEPASFDLWSPTVEQNMCNALLNTDILLLPYYKLSSTVDTPLLLLEGLASLCIVITPNLGNLQEIFGKSKFNLVENFGTESIIKLIKHADKYIEKERNRIYQQTSSLKFDTKSTSKIFRDSLFENK